MRHMSFPSASRLTAAVPSGAWALSQSTGISFPSFVAAKKYSAPQLLQNRFSVTPAAWGRQGSSKSSVRP